MATLHELESRDDFPWRESEEAGDHTVYVEERRGSKRVRLRWWTGDGYEHRSLGFSVRWPGGELRDDKMDEARDRARERARALRDGRETEASGPLDPNPTIAALFDHYEERHVKHPRAHRGKPLSDRYRELFTMTRERWETYLGPRFLVDDLSYAELKRFAYDRLEGKVDGGGQRVEDEDDRTGVRASTVKADLRGLWRVLDWARDPKRHDGDPPLPEVPVEWETIEREVLPRAEAEPRRPRVRPDRYRALLEVAGEVEMRTNWGGAQRYVPSFLPQLLALAWWTGRRIGSILALREADILDLHQGDRGAGFGWLRWRAAEEKTRKTTTTPILSAEARRAVDELLGRPDRPETPFLFPSPLRPAVRPTSRHTASNWLAEAEERAGLEPQDGSSWHSFRRGFVYHLRERGVIAEKVTGLGGWSSVATVQEIYGKPEPQDLADVARRLHDDGSFDTLGLTGSASE